MVNINSFPFQTTCANTSYAEDKLREVYKSGKIEGATYFKFAYLWLKIDGYQGCAKVIGKKPTKIEHCYNNQGVAELTAYHVDRIIGRDWHLKFFSI